MIDKRERIYFNEFFFFFEYTMRVCIGEGRVRVACTLLYSIFKFGVSLMWSTQ